MQDTRREFLKKTTSLAAVSLVGLNSVAGCQKLKEKGEEVVWPVTESRSTPKIAMEVSRNATPSAMRRVKQLGVDYVLFGGPSLPWDENELSEIVGRFQNEGLTVINIVLPGQSPGGLAIRDGRDEWEEQIQYVKRSLRAAAESGIQVVEYNWYTRRQMHGYYEVEGRGGSGYTGFDYDLVKDASPLPDVGVHESDKLWDRLIRFLEAVIPVAEEAGVRMALHPNDPPIPNSYGSDQIMASPENWKRLIQIVDSPANGITFDCGVTAETGADPIEICRYFGARDRINHVHFRNVLVDKPFLRYTEVFPDNGLINMYAVMEELVRFGYQFGIWPEHERALDYDREVGISSFYKNVGGGGYAGLSYNIGYTRAMIQAAITNNPMAVSL